MTRSPTVASVVVALSVLCAAHAFAQATSSSGVPAPGGISGYVVDAYGRPIPRAHVLALGTPRRAVTGSQGEYRIDSVPAGQRMVRIRAPRYTTLNVVLAVPSADIADLDVRLDSASVAEDSLAPPDGPELRRRAAERKDHDIYLTRPELDQRHDRVITDMLRGQPLLITRDGNVWSAATRSVHLVADRIGIISQAELERLRLSPAETMAQFAPRDECGRAWGVVLDGVPLEPPYRLDDIPADVVSAIEVHLPVAHLVESQYAGSPACGVVFVYTR